MPGANDHGMTTSGIRKAAVYNSARAVEATTHPVFSPLSF